MQLLSFSATELPSLDAQKLSMRILALDIGKRRTGVAFTEDSLKFPLPLPTIIAENVDALMDAVAALVRDRKITEIVVGLPLLPSGKHGAQATFVLTVVERLRVRTALPVHTIDERYSTPRKAATESSVFKDLDLDGMAACSLLQAYLGI